MSLLKGLICKVGEDIVVWFLVQLLRFLIGAVILAAAFSGVFIYYAE